MQIFSLDVSLFSCPFHAFIKVHCVPQPISIIKFCKYEILIYTFHSVMKFMMRLENNKRRHEQVDNQRHKEERRRVRR